MNLLVAVDGSEDSARALRYACDIAEATDGSITVVHAVDPDVYETRDSDPITSLADASDRVIIDSLEAAEERGREFLDEAVDLAADRGQDVSDELLYGNPVPVITDFAEQESYDTIYVGHRGRSERAIEFIGSVARAVVERATIPVTVVR